MEFLLVIAIIILWISHSKLGSRVTALEHELTARKNVQANMSVASQSPSVPLASQIPVHTPQATSGEQSPLGYTTPQQFVPQSVTALAPHENPGAQFIEWLQKDLLMKVGALFLLMGVGWFVSYAFIHNWIGPAGRIMLGLLTGAGVLALGAWRIQVKEHQGAIFTVLGSTIVLLTVFAARSEYNMFDQYTALGLMFLSVIFVTFVSLKYRRNSLALASLILAAVAPYLTDVYPRVMSEDFTYLLIIILGTLWVVYITGWRNLTFAALAITFVMTLPYIGFESEKYIALLWAFIFTAIFFVANVVSLIRQRGMVLSPIHMFTALGTALFLALWILGVAPKEAQSLLFVAWMLVFSFGTYLAYRSTGAQAPFYVYGGTSVALLAAATAAELEGAVLTIAYTFEVAVLVLVATAMRLGGKVVNAVSLLFAVPIILSVTSIGSGAWNTGILHEEFFNLLVLTLVFLIVGLFISERSKIDGTGEVQAGGVLITGGALYGLILFWLVMHAGIASEDTATMYTLIIYTVLGLVAYFNGKTHSNQGLRIGGGVLLGFVVCRLMLVDVWDMDLPGRIVTFLAIGVLLLSTAFIGNKHKQELPQ